MKLSEFNFFYLPKKNIVGFFVRDLKDSFYITLI